MKTTLDLLPPGQTAHICALATTGQLRQRLLRLGLVEGTAIRPVCAGPCGNPVLYAARGMRIALRRRDSRTIFVEVAP